MAENERDLKKRILAAAAGVLIIYWLVFHVFVSDETRIRRVLRSAAEGFNETHKSACLDALADDYRDDTVGLTRDQLGLWLVNLFLKEKPQGNTFRYRVEIVEDELKIEVADGPPKTAEVTGLVRFSKLTEGEFEPVWDVGIEGRMEETSDGWKAKRSRYHSVSGSSPF